MIPVHNRWSQILPGAARRALVPGFTAVGHDGRPLSLTALMGELGLLLAFVNDISLPSTIRRAQWLQNNLPALGRLGVRVALAVPNQPHTLQNFYSSSPAPLDFPLLADDDRQLRRLFQLNRQAGLVLITRDRRVMAQWAVPEEQTWPELAAITRVVEAL